MKRRLSELEAHPPIADSRKRARSSRGNSLASTVHGEETQIPLFFETSTLLKGSQEDPFPETPEQTQSRSINPDQTIALPASNSREDDDRFVFNPLVSPSTYVKNAEPRQRAWRTFNHDLPDRCSC